MLIKYVAKPFSWANWKLGWFCGLQLLIVTDRIQNPPLLLVLEWNPLSLLFLKHSDLRDMPSGRNCKSWALYVDFHSYFGNKLRVGVSFWFVRCCTQDGVSVSVFPTHFDVDIFSFVQGVFQLNSDFLLEKTDLCVDVYLYLCSMSVCGTRDSQESPILPRCSYFADIFRNSPVFLGLSSA